MCQQMPSRDFVTFAAACNEAYVIFGGCAEAVAMSPFGTKPTCRHVRFMVAIGGKADVARTGGIDAIDP
jgi:hypothetical protein